MATKRVRRPKEPVVEVGALPSEKLEASFPRLHLPIQPPFPPMEAKLVQQIPDGSSWQYEPKWDGFRCLAFKDGDTVVLQSKAGQALGRYFPELVASVAALPTPTVVIDGEIVITRGGHFSFDDLLMRIHPAESRIRKLSVGTPATMLVFDMLVSPQGRSLINEPLSTRRQELDQFISSAGSARLRLSPASLSRAVAEKWWRELAPSGFDGVIAKRTDVPYASGERTAMQKIKRIRSADCVVGGFRWASKGGEVGSLLLGLYDEDGKLNHVGFSSSFKAENRGKLKALLKPYMGGAGFTGRAPGGPSRWSTERTGEWESLQPKLVCEVAYDHFSGGRFRHGTKFMRWRPDKEPKSCTFEQIERGKGNVEDVWAA